jgi:spermidine synthase
MSSSSQRSKSPQQAIDVTFIGVVICFVLSGFAALLYQTVWMRQFSFVFGTSELAVATVLASYMGGLAAGSALAARFVPRVRRPVLIYGVLELGIAVTALLVPSLLSLARGLHTILLGGQAELPNTGALQHSLFFLACAFVIILLPTALMGATLPLLTRYAVRRREQIGSRTGLLYAMNTAGAVVGTLVAAFVLLPRLGLMSTLWVGAAVNAVVFLLAAALAKSGDTQRRVSSPQSTGTEESSRAGRTVFWILPFMLLSGGASFTYEILWTRLLSHLLGASLYAFATMLASFLTGITLGSAIASRWARTRTQAALGFVVAQAGTALLSIGVFLLLDQLPGLGRSLGAGEFASLAANVTLAAAALLPAALCIGATFPFALRVLAEDPAQAPKATARLYAWNTVGAIVGSVLAGFFVIPVLEYGGTVRLIGALNLTLALFAALLWLKNARLPAVLASIGLLAVAVLVPAPSPERLLKSSSFEDIHSTGAVLYQGVGRSASVILLEEDDSYSLRCNGLPEAGVVRQGCPPFGRNSGRWLSTLPVLARPDASSMMMIGFGGGCALEAIPPSVQNIDVIELEPKVIDANHAISHLRAKDPLTDSRLNIIINDARGALALSDKRYDIIVSQPSHPWTAGASHLYTREFLQQVQEHLQPNGVFVQWMLTELVSPSLLRSLIATLLDVFPSAELFRPIPNLLIVLASDQPLETLGEIARTGEPMKSAPQYYRALGLASLQDVAAMQALDLAGLRRVASGAAINTDNDNRLALWATRSEEQIGIPNVYQMLQPFDPLCSNRWPEEVQASLDLPYVVYRMVHLGLLSRANAVLEQIQEPSDRNLAYALTLKAIGQRDESQRVLQRAQGADPNHAGLRYALVEAALALITEGKASQQVRQAAAALKGVEAAVVRGQALAAKGDFAGLQSMEQLLASAPTSAACFLLATRLRCLWRCNVDAGADERMRLAEEALVLIDDALILHPDAESYLVRMQAAQAAGREAELMETATEAALFLTERASLASSRDQNEIRNQLSQLVTRFAEQQKDPEAANPRRGIILERLRSILDQQ